MPVRNIASVQPANRALIERAKELRQRMTPAEKVLWQALRTDQLEGWHFRRQQIVAGYIADFYCHAAALVIELDGGIHAGQQEYDQERTERMKALGIAVVRFQNDAVLTDLPKVLNEITRLCRERANSPSF